MNMNKAFREIFQQVRTEEALKESTRLFLAEKTQGYAGVKTGRRRRHIYALACACLLFTLLGGGRLYFTQVAAISIDINPSIELGVNRFDRVIFVEGFNGDGQLLSETLPVKHQNYTDAIAQVLRQDTIAALLSGNEVMTITVTGQNALQSEKILSKVRDCTAGQRNTYCYAAPPEEVARAHEMGLSYGKYRAFLEVRLLDPDMTPEVLQGMTMREIRRLINSLSTGGGNDIPPCNGRGNGPYGCGKGQAGKNYDE